MSFLAIVGGLLILAQGALDVANIVPVSPPDFVRPYLAIVGIVSIVAGLLTMYAGWLISKGKKELGSPLAIVFSVIGFAGGGGFIVGMVLGLVGGVTSFRRRA